MTLKVLTERLAKVPFSHSHCRQVCQVPNPGQHHQHGEISGNNRGGFYGLSTDNFCCSICCHVFSHGNLSVFPCFSIGITPTAACACHRRVLVACLGIDLRQAVLRTGLPCRWDFPKTFPHGVHFKKIGPETGLQPSKMECQMYSSLGLERYPGLMICSPIII